MAAPAKTPLPYHPCWMLMIFSLLLPTIAVAHPESISTVELQLHNGGAKVSLTLQIRDLGNWFPPGKHPDYKAFVTNGLKQQAADLFEFQADGQAAAATDIRVSSDKPGCLRVDLSYKFPSTTQLLLIRTKNLDKLPSGHQQLLCAEDQRTPGKPGDDPAVLLEQPLNAEQDFAEIQVPDAPVGPATSQPAP